MSKKFNWMPILKTGAFTAKNGKKVTFDEAELDRIIANTDLSKEPQFVVEHPSYDKLGFGTIESLKRVGQYLFALPKNVQDNFKNAVNSGELPGRSVAIDENTFALCSIGFLPKEIAPAVDGLGSYAFSSEDTSAKLSFAFPGEESHFAELTDDKYEFSNLEVSRWPFTSLKNVLRNLKNMWIEKFGKEEADQVFDEWAIEEIGTPPKIFESEETKNIISSFSTNQNDEDKMKIDVSKITDPGLREAVEALQNEFASTQLQLQSATQTISAGQLTQNRSEVLAFCESDDMKVRILPAEKEKVVNLLLATKEKGTLEFSAADNSKVQFSAYDFLKDTLKQLPVKIELQELATQQNAGDTHVADYVKIGSELASYVNPKK